MKFIARKFFCALCIINITLVTAAESSDADLCDQSIEQVADSSIVPREVIYKIARLESGRHIDGRQVSWPWSINNGGKGYFLKDKATALSTLAKLRAKGKTNIDVGCMQLNFRWHAGSFESLEQMMEPFDNVRYAVGYLEQLYKETGSWKKTVKFYHSRNVKFNTKYYAKYMRMKPPSSSQILATSVPSQAMPFIQNSNALQGSSLFWTGSTGALIVSGNSDASPLAYADIRNFRVAPLLEM